MNLDSLTHTSGEWLRSNGPESDIVISSRIRLARNLAAFPFTNRASAHQKSDIEALLRDRVAKLELTPRLDPRKFTVGTVPQRVREDPWKEYWGLRQRISDGAMRAVAAL